MQFLVSALYTENTWPSSWRCSIFHK